MESKITAKIVFRSNSTKILNFWKSKECFVQYFFAVQLRLIEGPRGHFSHFWKTEKARICAISLAHIVSI